MRAFELTAAIEELFNCQLGEHRAWTRNPPGLPLTPEDHEAILDGEKNWYAVFGYSCGNCTEEKLVNALWQDVQAMHKLCSSPRPTLIWRRKPEYRSGMYDRKRFRTITLRIVIPELAHGSLREQWLKVPSYKAECAPFECPFRLPALEG